SDRTIANPIATYGEGIDSVLYRVVGSNGGTCYGEDKILVRIFKKGPDIFVPSGFTPNGDGKNDILKPIPIGITSLSYFRIYNRWGELMFQTNERGKGWNGIFNGTAMPPGAYVYVAEGKDYTGKTI
ncbi:T9SS type B sorting domain-containing protein, partial [Vibrio parahaemolyticus]